MTFICGSLRVNGGGEFRSYSDLDEYVSKSGVEGVLLGEDASDFMSFYGAEVPRPFAGTRFRIGIILDNNRSTPMLCPIHGTAEIAIGMNNYVQFVNLNSHLIVARFCLDSCLHHILCNGKVLVAVHELGASIMELSTFQENDNVYCDVVADATLSENALVLVSMDGETTHVDLTAGREK